MLTAARLVAGLLFAGLFWYGSEMIKPLLPDGFNPRRMAEINAAIGFLVGWNFVGTRAGEGIVAAVSYGFTGTVIAVVWCLFVDSTLEMLRLSFRQQYDGPGDAIMDIFAQMLEYGTLLINAPFLIVMLGGGVIVGVVAEVTSRHAK